MGNRDCIMQQEQLNILKNLSGADFKFVPADKNKFGIKYYEYKCDTDAKYWNISGGFNQNNIIYRCIEHNDGLPSIIVLENELDGMRYDIVNDGKISNIETLKPIGKLNNNDIFLEPILTTDGNYATIVSAWGRVIAVVNINGKRLPFYVSSGAAKKDIEYGIPSGKWYPLLGMSEKWLNKMPDMLHNPYSELDKVCDILEQKFPAEKMNQDNSKGLFPSANHDNLIKVSNFDFPEGVSLTEYGNAVYVKNYCVYLPQIIDGWRSNQKNFLDVSDGRLASTGQKILNKIQKMKLFCGSKLQGDYIWFYPIEDNKYEYVKYHGFDSDEGIKVALQNIGIYGVYITHQNEKGFGIPVSVFVDYFEQQKLKNFDMGIDRVNKSCNVNNKGKKEGNNASNSLLKRFVGFFKD